MNDSGGAPVGVVGLGAMGGNMAATLLHAGHPVVGFDLDPVRVEALVGAGGEAGADVGDVARRSRQVLVSVPATDQLEAIADEIAESGADPVLVIDASTIDPVGAARAAATLEAAGHSILRSPVSGSTGLAASGGLVALCSGNEEDYRRAQPVLEAISASRRLVGEGEQARIAKLTVNLLVIGTMGLIGEALALAESLGLSREAAMDAVNASVVGSSFTKVKTEPVVERDFAPTGTVDLVRKDLALMLDAAASHDIRLPLVEAVDEQFARCQEIGRAEEDYAVVSELPRGADAEVGRGPR